MPWTVENPPKPAKNFTRSEKIKCVAAANATLEETNDEEQAIFACLRAAGKSKNKANTMEFKQTNVEFEFKEEDGEPIIEGLASTFGNIDEVGDIVEKGAFKKTLRRRKPKMLWQHNIDDVIGIWDKTKETDEGLLIKGKFADTQLARDARELSKMGAVDSLSIGFTVEKFDFDTNTNIRKLQEVNLFEVSLVTFPANDKAKIVAVKSLPETIRDFENMLRDVVGYSKDEARSIASIGFKGINKGRDALGDQEALTKLNDKYVNLIKNLRG